MAIQACRGQWESVLDADTVEEIRKQKVALHRYMRRLGGGPAVDRTILLDAVMRWLAFERDPCWDPSGELCRIYEYLTEKKRLVGTSLAEQAKLVEQRWTFQGKQTKKKDTENNLSADKDAPDAAGVVDDTTSSVAGSQEPDPEIWERARQWLECKDGTRPNEFDRDFQKIDYILVRGDRQSEEDRAKELAFSFEIALNLSGGNTKAKTPTESSQDASPSIGEVASTEQQDGSTLVTENADMATETEKALPEPKESSSNTDRAETTAELEESEKPTIEPKVHPPITDDNGTRTVDRLASVAASEWKLVREKEDTSVEIETSFDHLEGQAIMTSLAGKNENKDEAANGATDEDLHMNISHGPGQLETPAVAQTPKTKTKAETPAVAHTPQTETKAARSKSALKRASAKQRSASKSKNSPKTSPKKVSTAMVEPLDFLAAAAEGKHNEAHQNESIVRAKTPEADDAKGSVRKKRNFKIQESLYRLDSMSADGKEKKEAKATRASALDHFDSLCGLGSTEKKDSQLFPTTSKAKRKPTIAEKNSQSEKAGEKTHVWTKGNRLVSNARSAKETKAVKRATNNITIKAAPAKKQVATTPIPEDRKKSPVGRSQRTQTMPMLATWARPQVQTPVVAQVETPPVEPNLAIVYNCFSADRTRQLDSIYRSLSTTAGVFNSSVSVSRLGSYFRHERQLTRRAVLIEMADNRLKCAFGDNWGIAISGESLNSFMPTLQSMVRQDASDFWSRLYRRLRPPPAPAPCVSPSPPNSVHGVAEALSILLSSPIAAVGPRSPLRFSGARVPGRDFRRGAFFR
jgi:hypothetical protein